MDSRPIAGAAAHPAAAGTAVLSGALDAAAWCHGLSFLEKVVYQYRDNSLRRRDTATEVRTDFVQHLASALLDSSAFLEHFEGAQNHEDWIESE